MKCLILYTSLLLLFGCSIDSEPAPRVRLEEEEKVATLPLKGWNYLIRRLEKDGINPEILKDVYTDPRMPEFRDVSFKLRPVESSSSYSSFTTKKQIGEVRDFIRQNSGPLSTAQRRFGVDSRVVAAILRIESNFGENTGNEMILNRLSRVANIREPRNLDFNLRTLRRADPKVTADEVEARARYLEDTFYPELLSLFRISQMQKLDILAIRGSSAGAFGIPQFLPNAYINYGTDGNDDRIISLFDLEDSILSVANFLASNGWKNSLSEKEKRKVLWNYNKSEPYISAVIKLADKVREH